MADAMDAHMELDPEMYRKFGSTFDPNTEYTSGDLQGSDEDRKNGARVAMGRYSDSGEDLVAPRLRDYLDATFKGASNEEASIQAHGLGICRAVENYVQKLEQQVKRARQRQQEDVKAKAAANGEKDVE
ncbi:hypothetical protein LTR85_003363 [Meristemomyces frigidus]|nr:hypothetical protein LTR85_003363 [Meristemomyces frigidus]